MSINFYRLRVKNNSIDATTGAFLARGTSPRHDHNNGRPISKGAIDPSTAAAVTAAAPAAAAAAAAALTAAAAAAAAAADNAAADLPSRCRR